MRRFTSILMSTAIFVTVNYAQADGFGFGIGPFSIFFNGSDRDYYISNRMVLDDPICHAIENQERLELIVEGAENVSSKERKIVTKRLIVEPYVFGITREGKPVLRGNIVEDKLVKEVTVKFGEDKFDETQVSSEGKSKGFFSGLFSSDKSENIDIRKVSSVQVLRNSHFDVPKNYKLLQEEGVRVICQVSVDR